MTTTRRDGFHRLFWIFLMTSFLGCLVEMVFMLVTSGQLQNRSGVLYGTFSLVWGLGAVLFTVLFRPLAQKPGLLIFLMGTLLGTGYEYACSWVQEALYGACFWDYSHLPFHLNGRVNLLFSCFWGVAALLWVKAAYPRVCRWIDKIPGGQSAILTSALVVFMAANMLLSSAALTRMNQRNHGIPATTVVEVFLDQHYPDQRLHANFTNLVYIGTPAARTSAGLPPPTDMPG